MGGYISSSSAGTARCRVEFAGRMAAGNIVYLRNRPGPRDRDVRHSCNGQGAACEETSPLGSHLPSMCEPTRISLDQTKL
jgi:hypothetical protein